MKLYEQDESETPTLSSVYGPIESYLNALRTAEADTPAGELGATSIEALDFFLLHQWIAQYSMRPTVIDLAAEATLGASTLFFLGNPLIREVYTLPSGEWQEESRVERRESRGAPTLNSQPSTLNPSPAPCLDWRARLMSVVADRRVSPLPKHTVLPGNRIDEIRRCFEANEVRPPLLVLLPAEHVRSSAPLGTALEELLSLQQNLVVAVWPLGRLGDCRQIAELIAYHASHPQHRLAAFRDLCPFTATSQLGILHWASNAAAEESLKRLSHLFEGNFQFLSLARELTECHVALERATTELGRFHELQQTAAWRIFCRLRSARANFLPPGSRREQLARVVWRAGRKTKNVLTSLTSKFRRAA
jgi:hypothetical protein